MIYGDRVTLRHLRETDLDDTFNALCREEVARTFIINKSDTKEEFIPLFNRLVQLSKQANPTIYGIQFENRIVGVISLPEITDLAIEVGYAINPDYQNKGLATEAFKLIISFLFEKTPIIKVVASFFAGNEASMRVMQKCGLKYSHTNNGELYYRDAYHDLVYYELKREDYHE